MSSELVISSVGGYNMTELQGLSKQHRAPFIFFTPQQTSPNNVDPSNVNRYNVLTSTIGRSGQVSYLGTS